MWSVVELHVDQIKLDALDDVVHDIRGNKTLWRAGDNVVASIPCQLCLLHEVAKGLN